VSHIKTYGRQTIYAPYTEEQFLALKGEELYKAVIEIIEQSKGIHLNNHRDSVYLKNYLYGEQDIYKDKQKLTRPEIDNKTVENWAYAIVDFKKTYLLGKPIQYVQINDSSEDEISALNAYVRYENKKAKDLLIYEDVLTCGRGFRYVNKDGEKIEDEAPFEIINCPVEDTEVIYSNALGKKQLFAYIVTDMQDVVPVLQEDGTTIEELQEYEEYTVYTRDLQFVVSNKTGEFKVVGEPIPLLNKVHRITEYYINEKRIGLIELGKDLFNDINYLESLDKDDMEQFVNAIMVFTNAEVSANDLEEIRELGAVCINSTDQKKASIDLLQGRLNATDTQTYYNRLLSALHQILGVPLASDNGSVSYGDTGKAKLTGQGYTSAGIRAEGDETMFGMCDLKSMNTILAICRAESSSLIKTLKVSQLDARFQRDMSDNLLVKTQALMNLYSVDIPRKYANSLVNLFGDPAAVTKDQETEFGKQVSQTSSKSNQGDTTNDNDKATKQNNDINNLFQLDLQEQ
jgi:SPP1 family phage portal protein